MAAHMDWQKDFYHRDPFYGRNDYEPVIAIARGLLQNPKEDFCWDRAGSFVLADNSLLAQTMIYEVGKLRDARGIEILKKKFGTLSPSEVTTDCPLFPAGLPIERMCLEALAKIGGPRVRDWFDDLRTDPQQAHLHADLAKLQVADAPYDAFVPIPDDYPEILRGVRSYNDILNEGGCNETVSPPERVKAFLQAIQSLPFPGHVEYFSGDGHTRVFKAKTRFADNIHDFADPFTDFAIYRSDPKLEYPTGRRRWAISHTFLGFQVADGAHYAKEYTWDLRENSITTHFHEHIALEKATVNPDGRSITVSQKPISSGIELRGNRHTQGCTSAVRGIWENPDKSGPNHYVRRANILAPYKSIYYFRPLHTPIVNQLGIWVVEESERPERFFDSVGNCIQPEGVIEELLIPLHAPKILATRDERYQPTGEGDPWASRLPRSLWPDLTPVPPVDYLEPHLGARFEHSRCGQAGVQQGNDNGYRNGFDLNADGVIDRLDQELLAGEQGKVYRANVGDFGYFGINWLSQGWWGRTAVELDKKRLFVCSYDYGAGYAPETGEIRLFEPLPPGKTVYVEYFHDAPAAEGKDNIKAYLHPGRRG